MGDQSFARLIRKRRDSLGFSQARLGELVGRSATTIRNWERGNSTPAERADALALAAVLGLDEREVLEGAGFELSAAEDHQTIEQAYASLAPQPPVTDESVPRRDIDEAAPDADDPETDGVDGAEVELEVDSADEASRPAAADVTSGPPLVDFPYPPDDGARHLATDRDERQEIDDIGAERFELPEEAFGPESFGSEPSRAAPPTVLETPRAGEPSYLEDPEERQHYRVRALATAAMVLALIIVFLWSFDRATDALGTMWEDFFGMLDL